MLEGEGSHNFTDRVRRTLSAAKSEAARMGDPSAGPEHILLGLLREAEMADADSPATRMLLELGVTPEVARARLGLRLDRRGPRPPTAKWRAPQELTAAGKRVLEGAMDAARELHHSYVGTEHLLFALVREREGEAAAVLTELGVTAEALRGGFAALLRAQAARTFRVALDDTASASIYEQIVAQVKEAIATGKLRPGERLPTVRQLADELDIAPGTVARAYAQLERLGVVTTEGTRGTRVAERTPAASAGAAQPETLTALLRPAAVAAFHLGATSEQLRAALEEVMREIPLDPPAPP